MTLMNGTTPATSPVLYTEAGWTIVGTGDFNGDGKSDIVWRRSSDGLVTIWLMNANTQNGWTYFNFGTDWTVVGIGDFDGDGKSDILWRNSSTGLASMWLMNGLALKNPTAEIGWTYFYCGTDWTIAGTGDFDGDGKSDILWRNTSTGLVTLWISAKGLGATLYRSFLDHRRNRRLRRRRQGGHFEEKSFNGRS
jgi:hypothetical protein